VRGYNIWGLGSDEDSIVSLEIYKLPPIPPYFDGDMPELLVSFDNITSGESMKFHLPAIVDPNMD
jgi:hypothetical protein